MCDIFRRGTAGVWGLAATPDLQRLFGASQKVVEGLGYALIPETPPIFAIWRKLELFCALAQKSNPSRPGWVGLGPRPTEPAAKRVVVRSQTCQNDHLSEPDQSGPSPSPGFFARKSLRLQKWSGLGFSQIPETHPIFAAGKNCPNFRASENCLIFAR